MMEPMLCKNCGKKIELYQEVCEICGIVIKPTEKSDPPGVINFINDKKRKSFKAKMKSKRQKKLFGLLFMTTLILLVVILGIFPFPILF